MGLAPSLHYGYVHQPRVRRLGELLTRLLPQGVSVLDVGCGDGLLGRRIQELRPDVEFCGIDVLIRENTHIPVKHFDGQAIPESDGAFDVVLMVDVLHHTDDPMILLREAARVARHGVLIKDHTRDGFLAGPTLRFMDYVGNSHYGVSLPFNYWPKRRWLDAFHNLGLAVTSVGG